MEEPTMGSVVGFNKRRAEGGDKNDKPKNLQLKVRKLNPVNTTSYVQILGTGMDTQDTSPSVLLFFDKQRFIFNAGEGLQRYCTAHKIKLSKIDRVFLSRVCSETAGGLPGLLLTLAAIGEEGMSVNICGPSDLKYLIDAMRSFIPGAAMVHTHSIGPESPDVLIDNEVVKISAILIKPRYSKLMPPPLDLDEERDSVLLLPHSRTPEKIEELALKPGDISVVYICELPEIKGKFDPEKAATLGLRPGPKYRELQLGNSVKSDKQNFMVHPSDVLGPSIAGPIVLLVDCPTLSHLQDLACVQSLSCYYADSVNHLKDNIKSVNCIIHLSPSSVTKTATYQSWMQRFGEVQHIMAGHEITNVEIPILKSSARLTTRLNYLCPQFFPAPGISSNQHLRNLTPDLSEGSFTKVYNAISAENLLKFQLRPYAQLGLDRSGIPSLMSSTTVIDELLSEIPEIADCREKVRQFWTGIIKTKREKPHTQETGEQCRNRDYASFQSSCVGETNSSAAEEDMLCPSMNEIEHEDDLPSCLENISREEMEIVLLGTGSSQPSKYRNVSSVYVNLFSKGSLLLDCGEGSLGQLKRRYGVKGADDAIKSLKCIWISHIHADHHAGLARILSLRNELLRGVSHEPLLVIGPRQLKRFLDEYQRLEDLDMQFLDCKDTTQASVASESSLGSVGKLKRVLEEAGLESLVSVPVVHCPQSYGVVVKAAERSNNAGEIIPGWKLVYSGDTRPCPELINASQGATVLIHEATFEDGMVDEAIMKNHSTTKEAIEVGNSAGVYRIILTHFSQRYPKIPVFDETHMHNTCIAFDLMSINLLDLPLLPKVLPYLKLLFKNEYTGDEVDDVQQTLL